MENKIRKYLLRSKGPEDVSAFKKWERNEIDIDECIRRFTRNNNIREYDFTTDEFVLWMNSLGYRR